MKYGRIIYLGLWLGLTLSTPAHAELTAPLAQEVTKLSGANATGADQRDQQRVASGN